MNGEWDGHVPKFAIGIVVHQRIFAQIRANMSIYQHHSGFPAFAWPSLERMQGKIKSDSIHSSNNILYTSNLVMFHGHLNI